MFIFFNLSISMVYKQELIFKDMYTEQVFLR